MSGAGICPRRSFHLWCQCRECIVLAIRSLQLPRRRSESVNEDDDDYAVGYCKPPKSSRFKKGVSGNPGGRPPRPKLANDLRSMLERVANEEIEIRGQKMSYFEIELRSLQHKAAKGDVTASRHLAKLRSDAGVGTAIARAGVLVVPGTAPLEKWTAAAALQQEGFRTKKMDEESG